MRTSFSRMIAVVGLGRQACPKQGTTPDSCLSLLKPLSASRRLCGLHFCFGVAALIVLLAAQPVRLAAQNIPPMIGDRVGKPKLRIPNPLESTQTGGSQTSQSSQSGQTPASVVGEREVHSFLENWRSALSKKDVEALSSSYLQSEALARLLGIARILRLGALQGRIATPLHLSRRHPDRIEGTANERLWPLRLGDRPLCPANLVRGDPAQSGRSRHARAGKASIGLVDSSPACLDHDGSFPYELVHQIA